MATAISMTPEELARHRRELLDSVGMTYDELLARDREYTLRPEERGAYETIRSIDYLLGDQD